MTECPIQSHSSRWVAGEPSGVVGSAQPVKCSVNPLGLSPVPSPIGLLARPTPQFCGSAEYFFVTPSASRGESHPGVGDAIGTKGRVGMTFGQGSGPKMHPKAPVDPFSEAFSAYIWDSEEFTTISAPFNAFSIASSPPVHFQ